MKVATQPAPMDRVRSQSRILQTTPLKQGQILSPAPSRSITGKGLVLCRPAGRHQSQLHGGNPPVLGEQSLGLSPHHCARPEARLATRGLIVADGDAARPPSSQT